jgi:secondary thiamine-phosphate synthase enzyme
MERFSVSTRRRNQFVDITHSVAEVVARSGVAEGACLIYTPHTTCGLTINENADPDVPADIIGHLATIVPQRPDFRHGEGNADSHIKSSLFGCSQLVPISGGRLALGTWQGIFLCEADGARTRSVFVQILVGAEATP